MCFTFFPGSVADAGFPLIKGILITETAMQATMHVALAPKSDLTLFYGLANLLITDESSVIYEALLFDLPSLSIQDWKMGQNNYQKFRSPIIDKDVCFVCLKKYSYIHFYSIFITSR